LPSAGIRSPRSGPKLKEGKGRDGHIATNGEYGGLIKLSILDLTKVIRVPALSVTTKPGLVPGFVVFGAPRREDFLPASRQITIRVQQTPV
jgi:hypothetical protein